MQRPFVALSLVLASCALDTNPSTPGSTADNAAALAEADREADADALANIPIEPTTDVCSAPGHKYHCYAKARVDHTGRIRPYAGGGGLGASDLQSAYKL